MNAAMLVIDNVNTFGEYPLLVFEDREITNVQHVDRACRLATVLEGGAPEPEEMQVDDGEPGEPAQPADDGDLPW